MSSQGFTPRPLGRTGVSVGRLGISGGYGAPAKAIEMAFERGVNYFYHGSIRRDAMTQAIKNISASGKREKLFVVAQIYWRMFRWPIMRSFDSFRSLTGLDYVDGLLLGWHNSNPDPVLLDICNELKEKKWVRFIGISGHNRKAFPEFARTGIYDFFHTRYNAVHRGCETEVFPLLPKERRPGVVIYTATSWGQLLNSRKTPAGERTPSGSDCYRFVMTNPDVDICITGPKNMKEAEEALSSLDKGPMTPEEMDWMRRAGDRIHG